MIYKDVLNINQKNGPRKIPDNVPIAAAYLFHRYPDHNQMTIYRMTELPNELYEMAVLMTKNREQRIGFIEEMIFNRL